MAAPISRESDKFMLRLPEGMRDRIKAAADQNGRSMNAEIVATLDERYPSPESFDASVARMIIAIGKNIKVARPGTERTQAIEKFVGLLKESGLSDEQTAYWLDRVQKD
ncbi:MAG: Arc family DNA-binding protein [Pseudomonadota bacterium]